MRIMYALETFSREEHVKNIVLNIRLSASFLSASQTFPLYGLTKTGIQGNQGLN